MIVWIKDQLHKLFSYEKNPQKLAVACSLAIYIGFSPFVGLHTVMAIICAWLFSLSFPVLFMISALISNPWSMVPVYGVGYYFGDWLLTSVGIDHYALNPSWINSINAWLVSAIGHGHISFWAFLLGGNLLGVGLALGFYPLIKRTIIVIENNKGQVVAALKAQAAPVMKNVTPTAMTRTKYETGSPK